MAKRYAAGGIITVILCLILYKNVDLKSSLASLMDVDLGFMVLCALVYLCTLGLRAARFQTLLGNNRLSFMRMFAVVSVYNLFCQVMPAKTGEGSYPVLLKKAGGVDYSLGAASLLWARSYDLASIVFLYGLFTLAALYGGRGLSALHVTALVVVAASFVVLFKNIERIIEYIALAAGKVARVCGLRPTTCGRVVALLEKFISDFKRVKAGSNCYRIGLYSVAIWLSTFSMFYLFVNQLYRDVDFVQAVLGSSGAVFINMLPINSVGSVGILEAGWTFGYAYAGVNKEAALASGVLMHGFVIMFSLILSAIGAAVLRKAVRHE